MSKADYTKLWTDRFQFLVGSKIIKVDYMSNEEADELGWSDRPIQIHLDNGAVLSPQADDEGNDGGALSTGLQKESLAPALSVGD
tara:strand:+ start:2390 stop:2644 length:255 start_codon:yes stop_codon:yes gene_type:complete